MNRYEINIYIADKDYVDSLIVALARHGYDVYYNKESDNAVCFTGDEENVTVIEGELPKGNNEDKT